VVWLIGICLGLTGLYFWLVGHWFARIIAFVALVALLGGVATMIWPQASPAPFAAGAMLAWPLAGLPQYYRRAKAQKGAAEAGSARGLVRGF
jgi:hypothetical protein